MKTIREQLSGLPRIFYSPTSLFEALRENPHWLLPFIVAAIIRTVRTYVVYSPNRTVVAALLTFLIEGVLPLAIQIGICTAIFIGLIYAFGGSVSIKKVLSVLCHTFFVYTLITVLLSCLVYLFSPNREHLDIQNPVASNLGFLVSPRQSVPLNFLLSAVDLIVFYHIFLIALGLSIVATKFSFKKALLIVVGCYVLYVAIAAGIKAVVT
jgi:hypothetical protein